MAVAVGDVITAADFNAVETAATAALSHEEWTATSASTASSTLASVGTLTRDAGTSNATMFTISTNTLTVSASGIYDFTFTGTIATAPTGLLYARMTDGTDFYYTSGNTSLAAFGGATAAGLRLPAGTVLTWTFLHVSAASRTLTSRIRATKTGTY